MTVPRHDARPVFPLDRGLQIPLSQRLRVETKTLHTDAERSGVMRQLVRGALPRRAYVALLENLAALYDALEEQLTRHTDLAALGWLDVEAFRRGARLADDIGVWRSDDESAHVLVPGTREYVERLRVVGDSRPDLLVAHAYVRYLGDLSGGQILRPIVAKMLGASGDTGLSFYDFPAIADAASVKADFRERLDAIDPSLGDAIVAEAKAAFTMHAQLFRELEQTAVSLDSAAKG